MKKTGFTLAEVLITLAIIGVVATMTLPALMANTAEQQAKTGLKKMINTLTLAAETNSANNGFDYGSITSTDTSNEDTETQSLFSLLANNSSFDRALSGTGSDRLGPTNTVTAANYTMFFRDGSAISFNPSLLSTSENPKKVQSDGLPYGISIMVDTNGRKGPNALSNCDGNATNATTEGTTSHHIDAASNACNNKANRVIKDRFGVRLRNIYAVPNGDAARWAMNN